MYRYIVIAVFLAGCETLPAINYAPSGGYTPFIEWDVNSLEWGLPTTQPVNWCSVYG